jgi:hypothetical protein
MIMMLSCLRVFVVLCLAACFSGCIGNRTPVTVNDPHVTIPIKGVTGAGGVP